MRDGSIALPPPLTTAHRLLSQAVAELDAVAASGSDAELLSLLTVCEGVSRQLDQAVVAAVAGLDRSGRVRRPRLQIHDQCVE